MKSRGINSNDKLPVAETPEDVAVLYSWANLHGAKYRDFSASRREYRAQLRHRAAEQVKEHELQAAADAEAAAGAADAYAEQAESIASSPNLPVADAAREQALRDAAEASRIATSERLEAERRAEAAANAAAVAEREQREIAEAGESARRQADRYTKSEIRRRQDDSGTQTIPGEILDPYSLEQHPQQRTAPTPLHAQTPGSSVSLTPLGMERRPAAVPPLESPYPSYAAPEAAVRHSVAPATAPQSPSSSSRRRPQGYTPDDASGVRQIYRAPEFEPQDEYVAAEPPSTGVPVRHSGMTPSPSYLSPYGEQYRPAGEETAYDSRRTLPEENAAAPAPIRVEGWATPQVGRMESRPDSRVEANRRAKTPYGSGYASRREGDTSYTPLRNPSVSPAADTVYDSTRSRRGSSDARSGSDFDARRAPSRAQGSPAQRSQPLPEPTGPAWLYSPQTPQQQPVPAPAYVQPSVADTLQQSRERVAARWFALKGVFEPGHEPQEQPVRQKETRTPSLAVFSLAGGVGKTCLVATLGRALSSMGEKVLLTDTTSHGLLPFYFGASELRTGVVRTFSPPSGSTDAPIYLVSHDVDQIAYRQNDEEGQEQLIEQILENSKGTHRILLDLNSNTGWVARRMARLSPTVLVPVAPDMNSVISLQAVEKFFQGATDIDGKPIQPFYVLSQFDASLPLHLDVREVLRRQLGDRLLPFVIRRAPAVSEALAEGMTVVDYAPDAPVAEDYQNVANWLRGIAAPATAGFRNVRWSER